MTNRSGPQVGVQKRTTLPPKVAGTKSENDVIYGVFAGTFKQNDVIYGDFAGIFLCEVGTFLCELGTFH